MKLQIQDDHLRLRIDEDELATLLAGGSVAARTAFDTAFVIAGRLLLTDAATASIDGASDDYRVQVPAVDVRALAARLPTRDGLVFSIAHGGELRFDVDVRDSVRRRHA